MKSKGTSRLLLALAVLLVTANAALAQQGSSQQKYRDDAIVRDLKAGKLTVREAQILRSQREQTAVSAQKTSEKTTEKTTAKPVKPLKPLLKSPVATNAKGMNPKSAEAKHGKSTAKAIKSSKTSKAPNTLKAPKAGKGVKNVKPALHKPKGKAPVVHRTAALKSKHPVQPASFKPQHKNDAARQVNKPTASTRKTAVRYIK